MIDNMLSINNILVSLEGTLKLEASSDLKVSEIIDAAVQRLENTYAITLDRDVYAIQEENQLTADYIDSLLRDVKECLAQLSLYIEMKLFHKNLGLTLSDVNYLGYSKTQLLTALKYLQDKDEYKKHGAEVIQPLCNTLNNISMCNTKRMFIIMIMLDRLGITEGVAIMAQLLYLGGLVL